MARVPGLDSDVFFGAIDRPLPDWRGEIDPDLDGDEEASPEQREMVAGLLGFDPAELGDEEGEEDDA